MRRVKSTIREGLKDEALSAFKIDRKTGDLKLLNHQPSAGANPCHIGFDNGGKHAFVSNFDGGNVAVLPIADDGNWDSQQRLYLVQDQV